MCVCVCVCACVRVCTSLNPAENFLFQKICKFASFVKVGVTSGQFGMLCQIILFHEIRNCAVSAKSEIRGFQESADFNVPCTECSRFDF